MGVWRVKKADWLLPSQSFPAFMFTIVFLMKHYMIQISILEANKNTCVNM